MKVVYKYGTGQEIPSDAKYLCTKTETYTEIKERGKGALETHHRTVNEFVWHYYELKLPTKEEAK